MDDGLPHFPARLEAAATLCPAIPEAMMFFLFFLAVHVAAAIVGFAQTDSAPEVETIGWVTKYGSRTI